MQILERELASGDATYLKAIYELANAYITYRRNEDATQRHHRWVLEKAHVNAKGPMGISHMMNRRPHIHQGMTMGDRAHSNHNNKRVTS